jgi:hypothetical protein
MSHLPSSLGEEQDGPQEQRNPARIEASYSSTLSGQMVRLDLAMQDTLKRAPTASRGSGSRSASSSEESSISEHSINETPQTGIQGLEAVTLDLSRQKTVHARTSFSEVGKPEELQGSNSVEPGNCPAVQSPLNLVLLKKTPNVSTDLTLVSDKSNSSHTSPIIPTASRKTSPAEEASQAHPIPEESENCSICWDSLTGRAIAKPCRHAFHLECIIHWLRNKYVESRGDVESCVCPLCRSVVDEVICTSEDGGSSPATVSIELEFRNVTLENQPRPDSEFQLPDDPGGPSPWNVVSGLTMGVAGYWPAGYSIVGQPQPLQPARSQRVHFMDPYLPVRHTTSLEEASFLLLEQQRIRQEAESTRRTRDWNSAHEYLAFGVPQTSIRPPHDIQYPQGPMWYGNPNGPGWWRYL